MCYITLMLSTSLTEPAVVIGDLVGSRRAHDRVALQDELVTALDAANETCHPVEPLEPTIGDEFQGVFANVTDAVRATLVVRARMRAEHDARFGVGIGSIARLGERATGAVQQDGPGWWVARDAIDFVADAARSRGIPRSVRTWIGVAQPEHERGQVLFPFVVQHSEDPQTRALNAYLVVRDQLVSQMDDRDRRILAGLLEGRSVTDIAETEGISPSAVSQRSHRSGAAALAFSHTTLTNGAGR